MNWEIEEDVPMKTSKTNLIRNLKVGESFIVEDYDEARVCRTLFSRVGYKCSIKKVNTNSLQREHYRCWRVK
tara:strand:- start:1118 stop:1333 length:216 start_codon:yes stop_codon:yes gene_type:complete